LQERLKYVNNFKGKWHLGTGYSNTRNLTTVTFVTSNIHTAVIYSQYTRARTVRS